MKPSLDRKGHQLNRNEVLTKKSIVDSDNEVGTVIHAVNREYDRLGRSRADARVFGEAFLPGRIDLWNSTRAA